jgi:dolichol kinase
MNFNYGGYKFFYKCYKKIIIRTNYFYILDYYIKMDIFWIYKPKILIEEYYELLPTNKMSRTKQMNTITRLLIYLIILSLLFDEDNTILLLCLTMIIMIIIFYFINKTDDKGVGKDI